MTCTKISNKLWIGLMLIIVIGIFLPTDFSLAHRSGCHRWHSCPSDSGSYTCGDAGYPCQYPTYPAKQPGTVIYPPSGVYRDSYGAPLKTVAPSIPTYKIDSTTCFYGYRFIGESCLKVSNPANSYLVSGHNKKGATYIWSCNEGWQFGPEINGYYYTCEKATPPLPTPYSFPISGATWDLIARKYVCNEGYHPVDGAVYCDKNTWWWNMWN